MEKKDKNLNVPNLRFPEFSGEWEKCMIGDVLKVGNGKDYKHLAEGDIPVFGTGGYMLSVNDFLYDGDSVFIGRKGTINKPFFYSGKFWTVDTLFYTHSFNKVIPHFVYGLFQRVNWNNYNEASGVPSLSKSTIEKIPIAIPSIEEQQKISSLLSLLDQRIETQKKIIEKYESLIRGLYQFLFQQAKYDHFVSLGDISQISNGNSDVKDASMNNDGSLYPFFDRSDEIKFLSEYLFDKEAIIYPGEGAEFYPRYYNGKFALHQRCYAIYDISTDFIPRYLYHYCKTQNSYFVRNAVGSTVASLRLDTFKRLKIPAIPTHHQESLVMFLDKIEAKIECNRTILKKYEEQKKYLLSNLFI